MKKLCIFLDNGHGSNTPGKCSPDKRILEYKWNREQVALIAPKLEAAGIKVEIIVPETKDISLSQRVKRVNNLYAKYKAMGYECALVSVHINAAGGDGKWHNATGWTGWVSKNSSSKSKKLAQLLYKEAEKANLKGNRYVPDCKYWTANYYILKNTNCPAVLTENLFQDNKGEVDYLITDKGNNTLADLHVNAILEYQKQL